MNINAVNQVVTKDYAIYEGDCIELIRGVPDDSIHYQISSPPFVGLYKFSNSERDLSNSKDDDFFVHYEFLLREQLRIAKPGRLCTAHVMQLPTTLGRDGFIGMRDFRGDVIRAHQRAGWHFVSETCIFKDPVVAQQRTKSHRLLHKNMEKDSTISGQGLADYVVHFRKPGINPEPVSGKLTKFIGIGLDVSAEAYARYCNEPHPEIPNWKPWPFDMWVSVLIWQRYASPVWMDIDQTRTLQNRRFNPAAQDERDEKDEQHISPLQLDVIERCIDLWSNPDDVVLTPFLGIGSEVWAAVNMGRRGVGFELKPSYFAQAKRNLAAHKPEQEGLFLEIEAAE
jgi:DNA modification methylase